MPALQIYGDMKNIDNTELFEPLRIGGVHLAHRIVLAPLAR